MNNSELISKFCRLPAERQALALMLLAHQLTIRARWEYLEEDSVQATTKLRTLNEIQHRISAHVAHLLQSDEKRYPDDVLIEILCEHAQRGRIKMALTHDFEIAIERVDKDNPDKK